MGVKKKKEKHLQVVTVSSRCLDDLKGDATITADHVIWPFVTAENSVLQLAALKKVCAWLRAASDEPLTSAKVIHVLAQAHGEARHKNEVKRAISSVLQGLPQPYHDVIRSAMRARVVADMALCPATSRDRCHLIQHFAAMLDKFPIGEASLMGVWSEALRYVAASLKIFYGEGSGKNSPASSTEAMLQCLTATQVYNKLLQRGLHRQGQSPPTGGATGDLEGPDEQTMKRLVTELRVLLIDSLSVLADMLTDDCLILDCKTACGMTVVLVMRHLYGPRLMPSICHYVFDLRLQPIATLEPTTEALCSRFAIRDLSVTAALSLMHGLLATLTSDDLLYDLDQSGKCFLTDIIAVRILKLAQGLTDAHTKLIASRALVLLTSKGCCAMEARADDERSGTAGQFHGDAAIPQGLIQYAWNHWEDPVDCIRNQARVVFENTLQTHLLATREDPGDSAFLQRLSRELLTLPSHAKGKYGPLCAVTRHLGAIRLLGLQTSLPQCLMGAMVEQSLAPYVSELYEKLSSSHLKELRLTLTDEVTALTTWRSTWMDPMLAALCGGSDTQKTFIIEYVVARLLKQAPDSLHYIVESLVNRDSTGDELGALMTCLKQAKVQGILQTATTDEADDIWNGTVPIVIVRQALCHIDDQVRLDALGLLCDNHKTTEAITSTDLSLLRFFLPHNMTSQSPRFRQHQVALFKKLFIRLRDGSKAFYRQWKQARDSSGEDARSNLHRYKTFCDWLIETLFRHLHPGCAFPSRTTALVILSMMTHIMGADDTASQGQDDRCEQFALVHAMTPARIQTLMECLTDTFEQNKADAFHVLSTLPITWRHVMDAAQAGRLYAVAVALASTTRPQDGTTAAYLLRLLVRTPHLPVLGGQGDTTEPRAEGGDVIATHTERCLHVGRHLVAKLADHVAVARKSLLHAAATRPIYPMLHCVRYLLADVNLKEVAGSAEWADLIRSLVLCCFDVAEIVSPVVSNSSPEGNIPMDAVMGPGLAVDAVVQSDEEKAFLGPEEDSVAKVTLMPEYLVVCCWRSIKEVSLTLGQLTKAAPLATDGVKGLIDTKQLRAIGDYFIRQLLESRHRGAFELAYAGFVKMAEMLWTCPTPSIHTLPAQWLDGVMADVRSRDPEGKLCSTRRSAGVPFYVQALVSTEPGHAGRPRLKQLITELLQLATPGEDQAPDDENLAQVHSLNILRALYRDARLGDDVFPYIEDGIKAAMLGYRSKLWLICNSASLLFSALVVRIFGVKRTKDELSRKNCLTGRVFFHRFPGLFPYLLGEIREATEMMGVSGELHLHPGLFPVLMVLGRLYPSVIEGADSTFNLAAFVPYVTRCASSPVYKTRVMAAHAIRPLVASDQHASVMTSLLVQLPESPCGAVSQNLIHGLLLQISSLLQEVEELPPATLSEIQVSLVQHLNRTKWLLLKDNPCPMTRAAFLGVARRVCTLDWPVAQGNLTPAQLPDLTRDLVTSVTAASRAPMEAVSMATRGSAPALTEWRVQCAGSLLHLTAVGGTNSGGELPAVAASLLRNRAYEVRKTCLDFLCSTLRGDGQVRDAEDPEDVTWFFPRAHRESRDQAKAAELVAQSQGVFARLVAMVMCDEQHPETLTKALELLSMLARSQSLPWVTDSGSFDDVQIIQRLLSLAGHARSDISCASMRLLGSLVRYKLVCLKQAAPHDLLLRQWVALLEENSCSLRCVESRLACADVITGTARQTLVDPDHVIGDAVYLLWKVAVRLLRDDDACVRETMVTLAVELLDWMPPRHRGLCSLTLQPNVVLGLCLEVLVRVHWGADCLAALLDWIQDDLEPEWPLEENAVRLFDKGEMNTYHDNVDFIRQVATLLADCLARRRPGTERPRYDGNGEPDNVGPTRDSASDPSPDPPPEVDCRLQSLRAVYRLRLNAAVTEIQPLLVTETPYLSQAQYQCACTELFKCYTVLESLSTGQDQMEEARGNVRETFGVAAESATLRPNCLITEVLLKCS